jgi:hypothetical protein
LQFTTGGLYQATIELRTGKLQQQTLHDSASGGSHGSR